MNKKIVTIFTSATLLVLPTVTLAAAINVKQIINNVMNLIIWPIFIGAVVIMLVWAGILFALAQGDPSKIATAKKAVLWAVIGVVTGIAAFSALGIIGGVLGV